METRESKKMTMLTFSTQTTFVEMKNYVKGKAQEIYKEALRLGLDICGPVYWIYTGADGNPATIFQLEIAVPVDRKTEIESKFQIKELPHFKFVKHIHYGQWSNLHIAYQHIFSYITNSGLIPTGTCREVYIHIDFEYPENNITEIQVEIQ